MKEKICTICKHYYDSATVKEARCERNIELIEKILTRIYDLFTQVEEQTFLENFSCKYWEENK